MFRSLNLDFFTIKVSELLKEGEKFVDVWKSNVEKNLDVTKSDEALARHSLNQASSSFLTLAQG